ncbi:MAG: hypothetical protein HOQ02_06390 [Lysobacter sp.]|nr:hypothetical protein [Lysobacter sp.]
MGTNIHARRQAESEREHPPAGRDDDDTHALRAGKRGTTQRKSAPHGDGTTHDERSDARRSGSESDGGAGH